MSSTSEGRARQAASESKESAAVAKTYANKASQAEDFSNQAQASAEAAAAAESSSIDAATSAAASESNAAAAADASNASAQNATITANLYPSLDGDLGANKAIEDGIIPDGALFNVAVPAGSTPLRFADQYQNVAGVATPTGVSYPSSESVNEVSDQVTATDNRTQGTKTYNSPDGWLYIVDPNGRASQGIDPVGNTFIYGDATIHQVSKVIDQSGSPYSRAWVDSAGRVNFGERVSTGVVEYKGVPLSLIRGQLPTDFFFIGDSITAFTMANDGAATATIRNLTPLAGPQGWPAWAQFYSNGLVKFAGISATPGYTTSQVLSTHVPKAIAANNTFCVVLAGRNDIFQNNQVASVLSSFQSIFESLRYAGIIPVVCTMSAQTGNSTAQKLMESQINEFLYAYAEKYGLPFVDFHSATVNPVNGEWPSGYSFDASHPTPLGASLMGRCLADAMSKWVSTKLPRLAASQTTPATSSNLLDNPLFYTSTAGLPGGWVADTPVTSAVAVDPAISGNAWTVTAGAGITGKYYKTVSVSAGNKLAFSFKTKMTADSTSDVRFYAVSGDSTSTTYLSGFATWNSNLPDFCTYTNEFIVPAGVTQITLILSIKAATISIAQAGLFVVDNTDY